MRQHPNRYAVLFVALAATVASPAVAQTPAARELDRLATPLEGLLRDFRPFAVAARPGLRGLARATANGRRATRDALTAGRTDRPGRRD